MDRPGSEFYNRFIKSWLQDNGIELFLLYNRGKYIIAENFNRVLKNKIYKHMTVVLKNVYTDEKDEIIDKYDNTYQKAIKMKPTSFKLGSFIDFDVENSLKHPEFKFVDHVRISKIQKYLNIRCHSKSTFVEEGRGGGFIEKRTKMNRGGAC